MKATELASKEYLKLLLYGDAGTGKTCLAAQLPGRTEVWDFDHKYSSAVRYLKGNPQLEQTDVYQFGHLPVRERIPAFETRTKIIDQAITQKKPLPFDNLIIDSLTTLSHFIMEDYIYRSQTAMKRPMEGVNSMQDYQLYEKHLTRLLTGLLAQDVNLIVTAHVDVDKDELTGSITRKPLCKGKALAASLPVWFPEVYAAVVKSDGSRVLLTTPQNSYVARGQRGYAKEIPMTIEAITK